MLLIFSYKIEILRRVASQLISQKGQKVPQIIVLTCSEGFKSNFVTSSPKEHIDVKSTISRPFNTKTLKIVAFFCKRDLRTYFLPVIA